MAKKTRRQAREPEARGLDVRESQAPGTEAPGPESPKTRLGILISGSGTNLQAVIDACASGEVDAEVAVVISDKEAAYGLERARKAGIDAVYLDRSFYGQPALFTAAILQNLESRGVDLVVMAGYMRLLGRAVLHAYPDKVVNLHPALLPSFPGASAIHDAFTFGVKVTGVTVHLANEVFDSGPIVAQEPVRIEEDDTVETLEAKIHEVEHRLLPEALSAIVDGRVQIGEDRVVHISPKA
jgi:phosphoribosylglycinamide formyltransferase-1